MLICFILNGKFLTLDFHGENAKGLSRNSTSISRTWKLIFWINPWHQLLLLWFICVFFFPKSLTWGKFLFNEKFKSKYACHKDENTVNSNYTDWEGEGIHWFLVAGLSVLCWMYCHPVALDHSFLIPGILYEKK